MSQAAEVGPANRSDMPDRPESLCMPFYQCVISHVYTASNFHVFLSLTNTVPPP